MSCGDKQDLQGVECLAVKALFHEHFTVVPEEESQAYMHFNVPASEDERLAAFFAMLDERAEELGVVDVQVLFFFFFTLVTGPRRSLSLKMSDKRVYEPQIRARLGTTAHFCAVVVKDERLAAFFAMLDPRARRSLATWMSRWACLLLSLLHSSLELSDTKVYAPEIRARLGTFL